VIRLFVFLLLLVSALNSSAQQRYKIADLRALGSQRYSSAEVTAASGLQKGREFTLDEVKASAQKLIASGVFAEVAYRHSAAQSGMQVQFTVKDAVELLKVDFENLVWIPPQELSAQLRQRVPLFKGFTPFEGTLNDDLSAALQEILGTAGVKGHVSYRMQAVPGQKIRSLYFIVDDVDVKIAQVKIIGASTAFDTEVQKEANKVLGEDYVRGPIKYFADHSLRSVFASHGYLKAQLGDLQPTVLSTSGGTTKVGIEVPVELGKQYRLTGLKWSGASAISIEKLGSYLHLGSGVPVDGRQFDEDLARMRTQYERRGYMKTEVNALPSFDDAGGTVSYQIAILEGPQYKMGKLEVEGLAKNSAEKLRNAWKLREGEPYDRSYIADFLRTFQIPAGASYNIEQEVNEESKVVDTTLVFGRHKYATGLFSIATATHPSAHVLSN
jgi:outer membrane protein insertion porin family